MENEAEGKDVEYENKKEEGNREVEGSLTWREDTIKSNIMQVE